MNLQPHLALTDIWQCVPGGLFPIFCNMFHEQQVLAVMIK